LLGILDLQNSNFSHAFTTPEDVHHYYASGVQKRDLAQIQLSIIIFDQY
jgi:hypothetical protein